MKPISDELREKVRRLAKNRCEYCLTPQEIISMLFEIDHILPLASGGTSVEGNLCLACRNCNGFKYTKTHAIDPISQEKIPLFNPRQQKWSENFELSQDKTEIIGKTSCGRATVIALRLNFEQAVSARKVWVSVGWFPPEDFD